MPVLYYRDPADNEWKTLLTKGPAGPPGPQGPQGEPGDDADVTAHEAAADPHAGYVKKSGDTMTASLTFPDWAGVEGPTLRLTEVTGVMRVMDKVGGAAANLGLADPVNPDHAATKQYADKIFPSSGKSLTPNVDLNTVRTAGFYFGYQYTNGPTASGTIQTFIVIPYSNDWGNQIAIQPLAAGPKVWVRSWTGAGGNTWSAWKAVTIAA